MDIVKELSANSRHWLITGCAGFIGSNLAEYLLRNGQTVTGVDNLLTGHKANIEDVTNHLDDAEKKRFQFIEGDLQDERLCEKLIEPADVILHQAALGSVPRSMELPLDSHRHNVDTFANMVCVLAKKPTKRFVYASSSSVYGDHPALPKKEPEIGQVLSPYALTKKTNEIYADLFSRAYSKPCRGLRYFNVFGRRQDPNGAYAAVIPRWIQALIRNEPVNIFGDGETSRDFTHVDNVVEINIKSALVECDEHQVFNVAVGDRTTLNDLYQLLKELLSERFPHIANHQPEYQDFRPGDIRHSQADISFARKEVGYDPQVSLRDGMQKTLEWYIDSLT